MKAPVIRAAVFSDTHGTVSLMRKAIRQYRPDVIIHLGDCERDTDGLREEFPESALYTVAGNCDMYPFSPIADVVPLGPVKAFITHGHQYDVKWGDLSRLAYAALEEGARIAMFGHTHIATYEEIGSVKLLNPGTAGHGRQLTWAAVEVYDNCGIAVEIKPL